MFLWCYLYYNDKAVYDVWLRIAVAGAPDMFLVDSECFVFSKMEANSNECPAPEALSIQLSSFEYVLVEQTSFFFFYVWGLESFSSPCTVFALMPFKNIHLSSDLFTLALIEAVWFAYRWQLKGIRDQEMEHGAKNVYTQYCKCLWAHLFLCCAKWCSSMCLCFHPYTVFIISQVGIAILIMLLERHNVANHAVLKLTATLCQVWWCIALIISRHDSEIDL